jgi:hypothetical protein
MALHFMSALGGRALGSALEGLESVVNQLDADVDSSNLFDQMKNETNPGALCDQLKQLDAVCRKNAQMLGMQDDGIAILLSALGRLIGDVHASQHNHLMDVIAVQCGLQTILAIWDWKLNPRVTNQEAHEQVHGGPSPGRSQHLPPINPSAPLSAVCQK